jgi:hypothetical protein
MYYHDHLPLLAAEWEYFTVFADFRICDGLTTFFFQRSLPKIQHLVVGFSRSKGMMPYHCLPFSGGF